MIRPRRRTAAVAATLSFLFAGTACSNAGDDDAARQITTSTPVAATAEPWTRISPGGDCLCADGSEFSFWVRTANPEKVVLFFQGGGACFSAESCSFTSGTYKVTTDASDDPTSLSGIFDFDNEANPFGDHSFVYVPYCTGDVHIGDATTEYAPGLTVQHKGFVNGTAALDHLAATFPDASEVVVAGESAGSIPSPLFAGLVADRQPGAAIVVLADGSGAYADVPGINATLGSVWGTANSIPDWPENEGISIEQWSFPGLFVQSGRHAPEIVFARHDYAYDEVQEFFAGLAGVPPADLVSLIDANEVQVERGGVDLLSYIAPGSDHTVLSGNRFYTEEVERVRLVDWVTDLVAGEPVVDVHCDECAVD